VKVPVNAFLNSRGNAWECERGFRQVDSRCVALNPPAHALVDDSGNAWRCDVGFRKQEQLCVVER
jgi:hypothetical protein